MDKGVIIFEFIFLNWNGRNTGNVRGRLSQLERTSLFKFRCTFVLKFGSETRLTTSWLGVRVCVQVGSRAAFPLVWVTRIATTTNPRASGDRLSEQLWYIGSGQAC